ncbi:hypothetical protein AVEN_198131-1 [Araneus ventricosus]|uniref:Uncharacterized protein n=1 Tax=Araneus ventricosus TaxID=182803 RepID=A0A4Y2JFS4_ARAVE|nr:hypothetical protein AVEN_198131-1 [Araneus ventricosus]
MLGSNAVATHLPRVPEFYHDKSIFLTGAAGFVGSTRILTRDRRRIIDADFNDGDSTSVSVRTVQRTVINMGSQSRRPTLVPLLTALHKALLLYPGLDNTTIGLLMTGNTLLGLTSLISNCIGRMHV